MCWTLDSPPQETDKDFLWSNQVWGLPHFPIRNSRSIRILFLSLLEREGPTENAFLLDLGTLTFFKEVWILSSPTVGLLQYFKTEKYHLSFISCV